MPPTISPKREFRTLEKRVNERVLVFYTMARPGSAHMLVLTGNPCHIDSPYLDSNSNGLTFLVETFKAQEVFGHVMLEKSERSPLAELAATCCSSRSSLLSVT